MLSRFYKTLLEVRPSIVLGTFIVLEAIAFLTVLPVVQGLLAPGFGMLFADNYEMLGRQLSQGHGYRMLADTSLTMMREPGYPIFLAGLFWLFGVSLTAARMANLIFSFLSALLICRLARRVTGNELVARVAPLLFLLHPGVVLAEVRGGLECLFILLLLIFFELLYRALKSGRLKDYLFAGFALGLSVNVRSTALLFPTFLVAWFFFWEKARPPLLTMAKRFVVLMIAAFIMLSPWITRNYLLVQRIVPAASVAGVSTYAGYYICTHLGFNTTFHDADAAAGNVRAEFARAAGLKFKQSTNLYYLYFYDPRDELEFSSILGRAAVQNYMNAPLLLPTCAAKNVFHFWFSGRTWMVTFVTMLVQLPYIILAVAGLVVGLRGSRRSLFAPLLLFIVYTVCVYVPILAQARYSVPLVPFLAILAAVPLTRRWHGASGGMNSESS
jgi:4-amino-4-deoxy-L-arabinose transferase-like glycosyltransferase